MNSPDKHLRHARDVAQFFFTPYQDSVFQFSGGFVRERENHNVPGSYSGTGTAFQESREASGDDLGLS